MGDVAILVPVLEALLKQNPSLKITVLTQPFFTPIFKNLKNVVVFPVEKKGKHKGFLGLFKLYKELKKHHYTAIADVHNVLRSRVLKLFFFGKNFIQIDKGRKEKKELISKKNFKQLKTSHERYADVFRKLGFKIDLTHPTFPEKGILPSKIKDYIEVSQHKKIIGIAPFAAHKSKMYSLKKMKTVVEQLSKEYLILLFGGKNDIESLDNLASNNNVLSVAGKLTFSEELDTISNLDCMLSMDSGNAHLAAMYGVKVITIWGVTHPFAGFAPFNQPRDYAILPDLEKFSKIPTSIYGNKYPDDYLLAADSISPEKIIKKIKSVL
ncbi:ADP-heptose--LPS heptosyltransferase RfaF [Polaribacter sp. ALD11]|uniref:glycosyltransferase family 9 protein n=1 Tax=Polaribacter sp. ALD11 TaxID=2058137 RepID=UPI000C30599F|nr:glycosyltransferase family 9 protein [Polaribacter sp. ALD11]AUC85300.1 ADP-heptose--LPS heptosyltransferase RfaF [Polaribacter sp. ALD11]